MINVRRRTQGALLGLNVKGLAGAGRPFGVITVTEFGAKGDGVADDSDAIPTAVDKSGVIVFPLTGNYYHTTRTIAVMDGTHLVGVHGHYATTAG